MNKMKNPVSWQADRAGKTNIGLDTSNILCSPCPVKSSFDKVLSQQQDCCEHLKDTIAGRLDRFAVDFVRGRLEKNLPREVGDYENI